MGIRHKSKRILDSLLGTRKEHPPLPRFLQLEHTTSCNFNCITCSRKTFAHRLNKNLTLDQFKAILQNFPDLEMINMTGMGESFLNPDLLQMLEYSKNKNIATVIGTNGSIIDKHLDTLKYIERLGFSLDSSDPKSYENIRPGGDFNKIIDNIKKVVEDRNSNKYQMEININSVICDANYMQIPTLAGLASELGVDFIGFVEAENWEIASEPGYKSEKAFITKAREKHDEIKNLIKSTREQYPKLRIVHTSTDKLKPTCMWVFQWAYITVDGYAVPCCRRPNPQIFNFGNVFETPFKEIWNSKKYVDFRRSMNKNLLNPICDDCPD